METAKETKVQDREIPIEQWLSEAEALFGEDQKLWRFVCVNCGHVQSIGDFVELRDAGMKDLDPQTAYLSCIGRFDKRIRPEDIGTLGDAAGKKCCNYTLGGLIPLNSTIVVDKDGGKHNVFEFADPE